MSMVIPRYGSMNVADRRRHLPDQIVKRNEIRVEAGVLDGDLLVHLFILLGSPHPLCLRSR